MKKVLALALALVLALSLTACGGKDDPKPAGSGTTDPGTQQTDPGTSQQTPSDSDPDNEIDEAFFTDTDTKGVVDNGDCYQICYHDGDTITGVEDWYALEEGVSAQEMISVLEKIHAEDDYITKIYQNGNYVVVEYSAKDYYTHETWEEVKRMYD